MDGVNCLASKHHTGQQDPRCQGNENDMRSITICLLLWLTLNLANAQHTRPESLAEVKPEIVFQDGSTFKYDTDFRTWSEASGNFSVSAKFDRFLGEGTVRLRREDNEKLINVKIEILAPDDRALLERIRKQIDAVLIDKKEKEAFAVLTEGWEEAISARYKYLTEMHEVYADEEATEAVKQQRLLAINEKYKKSPRVLVHVAMLVKEVRLKRGNHFGFMVRMYTNLVCAEAAKYSMLQKNQANGIYTEHYHFRQSSSELARFTKELNTKRPIVVGDLVRVGMFLHPVPDKGLYYTHWKTTANPVKGLKEFQGTDLNWEGYKQMPDLANWAFITPDNIPSPNESLTAKVLTDEQKNYCPN